MPMQIVHHLQQYRDARIGRRIAARLLAVGRERIELVDEQNAMLELLAEFKHRLDIFSVAPTLLSESCEPTTEKNGTSPAERFFSSCEIALAKKVLPVPGTPYKRMKVFGFCREIR